MNVQINKYDSNGNKTGYWEEHFVYLNKKLNIEHGTEKGKYSNGKREGLWNSFLNDESLYKQTNFINGEEIGKIKVWHKNSKVINYEGQYDEDGRRIGWWKWYNERGIPVEYNLYFKKTLISQKNFDIHGNLISEIFFI